MSEHTKTPWKWMDGFFYGPAHRQWVASATAHHDDTASIDISPEDAAFIIKAVNCHDELLTQLKRAQRMLLQTNWQIDGAMDDIAESIAKAEAKP